VIPENEPTTCCSSVAASQPAADAHESDRDAPGGEDLGDTGTGTGIDAPAAITQAGTSELGRTLMLVAMDDARKGHPTYHRDHAGVEAELGHLLFGNGPVDAEQAEEVRACCEELFDSGELRLEGYPSAYLFHLDAALLMGHAGEAWRDAMTGLIEIVEARNSQGGVLRLNAEGQRRLGIARALLDAAPAQNVRRADATTAPVDAYQVWQAGRAAASRPVAGQWVHCSPSLLNAGVICADTPRRACACGLNGSHDHFIAHEVTAAAAGEKAVAIYQLHCPPIAGAGATTNDLRERVTRLLLDLHASDTLSEGQCAKILGIDRISWRKIEDEAAINDPALTRPHDLAAVAQAGAKRDETLPFEQALLALIGKIDCDLDTGDVLADARLASGALDAILGRGDLVANAHDYFRDSPERYEKTIGFRIGWNACLDAIESARAAAPVVKAGASESAATVVNVGPGEEDMEVELLRPLPHGTALYTAPVVEQAGAALTFTDRQILDAAIATDCFYENGGMVMNGVQGDSEIGGALIQMVRSLLAAHPTEKGSAALTGEHMRELKNMSGDPRLYESERAAVRAAVALLEGAKR
jgi:hypothetical protein